MTLLIDERQLLAAYGIPGKMQDNSILDYPDIKKWFASSEADLVLKGEKGLILNGGWRAAKIGYAIMRWFILAPGFTGAVIQLNQFQDYFNNPDYEEKERFEQDSIFIEDFADNKDDTKFPLSSRDLYRVQDYVKNCIFNKKIVVLQIACFPSWYSCKFIEFLRDCFIELEIDDEGFKPT